MARSHMWSGAERNQKTHHHRVPHYALVTNAPALNIDPSNHAGIVHDDIAFADENTCRKTQCCVSLPQTLPELLRGGESGGDRLLGEVSHQSIARRVRMDTIARLWVRQHGSPASQKLFFMGAEDIGQFRPMWSHRGTETRSRPNEFRGLGVERIDTSATCI